MLAACCFGWFAVQRVVSDRRINTRLAPGPDLLWLRLFSSWSPPTSSSATAYYGEWLPNTYYAKHVRPWYESGFRYLTAAALGDRALYLLLPLALLALTHTLAAWHQDGTYALALLCVAAHMAYLLPIGGDHLRVSPPGLLLASVGSSLRPKASLCSAPGFQPACEGSRESRVGRPLGGTLHDCALPARALLRQRDSGILVYSRGFGDTRAGPVNAHAELNDQKNAGWLLAAPGMPVHSSQSPTICAACVPV